MRATGLGVALLAGALSSQSEILDDLRPEHPLLFLTAERLHELRAQHLQDAVLQRYVGDVLKRADRALTKTKLEHVLKGPRLLSVSRDCLSRTQALSFAWRWTGAVRYRDAARDNLLAVAAFPDWNPSHFLDTAEMSHAVGLGYDWLFDALTDAERSTIRQALIRLGMIPGIQAIDDRAWWTKSAFNWNLVCFGGLSVGALAIADSDPAWAERIVPAALEGMPLAIANYAPTGAWAEGPAYWGYATAYLMHAISAFESALDTDFALMQSKGLDRAGLFPVMCTGPTGLDFNFADARLGSRRRPMGAVFWLSRQFHDSLDPVAQRNAAMIAASEREMLERNPATLEHVLHYVPQPKHPVGMGRMNTFSGLVPVTVIRSGADGPFVAIKGGQNGINHGQLDAGSFVLDALGQRWVTDLGKDDYNLPGYFDRKPGGRRWTYYRNRTESHNVIYAVRDGEPVQQPITDQIWKPCLHVDTASLSATAFDLSGALPGTKRWRRGLGLTENRLRATLIDELESAAPIDAVWSIVTAAEIELADGGRSALLSIADARMKVTIHAPSAARFAIASCTQEPPQATNAGYRRLTIPIQRPAGTTTVRVTFTPVTDVEAPAPSIESIDAFLPPQMRRR